MRLGPVMHGRRLLQHQRHRPHPDRVLGRPKWSLVPSPDHGAVNNILDGVSCVSARLCQAVGYSYDSSNPVQTVLIESWNGTRWSIIPSANNGTAANILYGVSCRSSTSCQAVGYFHTASEVVHTLIESWNGVAWSIVPSPNDGANDNYLLSVSCASPQSCQAVGQYTNAKPRHQPDADRILEWCCVVDPPQPQQRDERQRPPGCVVSLARLVSGRWPVLQHEPSRLPNADRVLERPQLVPDSEPEQWDGLQRPRCGFLSLEARGVHCRWQLLQHESGHRTRP